MTASKFIKGTLLLSVAGIIVKILGAVYRIPLASIIGAEGMSYYQTAYPIYSLLLTVSTTGLPVAVAKLISERVALEDHLNADKIFKLTSKIMIYLGIITALGVYFFADDLCNAIENPNAKYALIALAPALFAAPLLSSYRGFFQGRQNMLPTAVSQITEQIGRLIAGLGLSYMLLPKGVEISAGGASLGGSVGAVVALITMLLFFIRRKRATKEEIKNSKHKREFSEREIFKSIIMIALPITLGAAIIPLTDSIDAMLFPTRLQSAGFTLSEANKLHGDLKGLAQTLINFPMMFLYAVSVSMVPSMAEANITEEEEKKKSLIYSGFRLSSIISFPSAFGLCFLAFPIINLLYFKLPMSSQENASNLLMLAAFQLIFLGMIQSSTAILQGVGHPTIPALNMLIGAVVKVILSYVLMGIAEINIYGMTISSIVCLMVVALLDFKSVERTTEIKIDFSDTLLKPLIAAAVMGGAVYFIQKTIYSIFPSKIAVLISVFFGMLIYFLMLMVLKTFKEEDFLTLPKGEKISGFLKKKGWL